METKKNNNEDKFKHEFTSEDVKEFNERYCKRISGESKTYSWAEAKEMIVGNQPPTQST